MMASVAAVNSLGGHAHNPRGNLWYNDDSTFGHKLLMKMGWTKGKGLGKKEDGIKENLKVKFRSTNSGLGFKDDAYSNVMKTEYESILKNLAAEYSRPGITNIKEDYNNSPAKVVKSKLRYPKLFFGKDVTKYSEKDMKSIFICSNPLKSIEEESEKPVIADKEKIESESPGTFHSYSSGVSISDYFAKKMEAKKKNALNYNSNDVAIHQQTSLELKNSDSSNLTVNENLESKIKQEDPQADIEKVSSNTEESNHLASEVNGIGTEIFTLSNKKLSRKRKRKSEINGTKINSSESELIANNRQKEENNSNDTTIHQQTSLELKNSDFSILTINENLACKRKYKDPLADTEKVPNNTEESNNVAIEIDGMGTEILSNKKPPRKRKKKFEINSTEINSSESELFFNNREEDNNNSNNTAYHEQIFLEPKTYDSSNFTMDENSASKKRHKDPQTDTEKMSSNTEESNHDATEIHGIGTEIFTLPNKKSSRKRKKKAEINGTETNSSENELILNNTVNEVLENSFCKTVSSNSSTTFSDEIRDENSRPNKKRKVSEAPENDFVESSEVSFPSEIKFSSTKSKKKKKKKKCETIHFSSEKSVCQNEHSPTEIHQDTNSFLTETVEAASSDNRKSSKKKKKSKKKLKEKLKSCLKNKSGSYSLKNVSFNESVSYRIIDSFIESVDPLASNESLEENTSSSNLIESNQNNPSDDICSEDKTASVETNSDDNIHAKEPDMVSEESDEEYKLSDLPSSKSSHYNAWVESQRQAIRMQLYKKMLKSIKHHKILKTTNLLHVKGYGNWGYQ